MQLTIEVSEEEYKEISEGKNKFLSVPFAVVVARTNAGLKSMTLPVVGVSVHNRTQTMLIQVEGKR